MLLKYMNKRDRGGFIRKVRIEGRSYRYRAPFFKNWTIVHEPPWKFFEDFDYELLPESYKDTPIERAAMILGSLEVAPTHLNGRKTHTTPRSSTG